MSIIWPHDQADIEGRAEAMAERGAGEQRQAPGGAQEQHDDMADAGEELEHAHRDAPR